MLLRRAIVGLGLAAVTSCAQADPYRDKLPVPSYRILASMLAHFRDRSPLERAGKPLDIIAPLMRALDEKYGAQVERALRRAIDAGDRDGAFAATTLLVLLDAGDLIEGIRRDDYTGWSEARVRAKKAFLDYGLVAEDMRRERGDLDRRIVMDFGRLAVALHDSDMTTPPESIDAARTAVVADLAAMRVAVAHAQPGRSEPGGGH